MKRLSSINLLRNRAPPKLLRLLRRTQYKVAYWWKVAQNFVAKMSTSYLEILHVSKVDQGILRDSEAQKLIWES